MLRCFAVLGAVVASLPGVAGADITERQGFVAPIEVSPAVLGAVKAALPDGRAVNQAYLSPAFDPNLLIGVRSSVNVTFLADGALYRNALGYFTYVYDGSGVRILDRELVFPNTSAAGPRGTLQPGDTAPLRDSSGLVRYFDPGTRIGFFLVSNGWTGHGVTGWSERAPQVPSLNAAHNGNVLTTLEQLNPETAAGKPSLARHVAMIRFPGTDGFLNGQPFLVMGMEDVRRDQGSDEDFNDLVFVVHASSPAALNTTRVPDYATAGDPDGDGVSGLSDAFPNDPSRATVTTATPTLPGVNATTNTVLDGQGNAKDVEATFDRAVSRQPATLVIQGISDAATGSVRIERYSATGAHSDPVTLRLGDLAEKRGDGTLIVRIPHLFAGDATDSGVESTRVMITFDQAISRSSAWTWQVESLASASKAPARWLREWSVGIGR